ncbi:MAG: hypothetical protein IKY91_03970 [Akkermansia sp.]|nr:hypothetical protein [Akkermansia sp.]
MSTAEKWQRLAEKWETSERPKTGAGKANLKTCTACVKACEVALAEAREVAESAIKARDEMRELATEVVDSNAMIASLLAKHGNRLHFSGMLELVGFILMTIFFIVFIVVR